MLFVGVDAHKSTSQVTVVDAGGRILKRRRVSTSPDGFQQALGEFEEPLKAVQGRVKKTNYRRSMSSRNGSPSSATASRAKSPETKHIALVRGLLSGNRLRAN